MECGNGHVREEIKFRQVELEKEHGIAVLQGRIGMDSQARKVGLEIVDDYGFCSDEQFQPLNGKRSITILA